jgi:hypothetical protein
MDNLLLYSIIGAVITGALGRYVASEKGRSGGEGFLLGFLFSILGVINVALLPAKENDASSIDDEQLIKRKKEIDLLNKKNKAKTENKRYIFVFINIVYK